MSNIVDTLRANAIHNMREIQPFLCQGLRSMEHIRALRSQTALLRTGAVVHCFYHFANDERLTMRWTLNGDAISERALRKYCEDNKL